MSDSFVPSAAPDPPFKCQACKSDLTTVDKPKTRNRYYKNCQKCRDKRATANRNRKELRRTPATSSYDMTTGTPEKREMDVPSLSVRAYFERFPRTSPPNTSFRPISAGSFDIMRFSEIISPTVLGRKPQRHLLLESDESDSGPSLKRARIESEHADSKAAGLKDSRPAPLATAMFLSDIIRPQSERKEAEQRKREAEQRKREAEKRKREAEKRRKRRKKAEKRRNEAVKKDKANTNLAKVLDEPPTPAVLMPLVQKECSVCTESHPIQEFPTLTDCDHDHDVCRGCFLQWLDREMERVNTVMCPSSGCSNAVTHEDVQKYASHDVYTR
jgi:hypothetical protein